MRILLVAVLTLTLCPHVHAQSDHSNSFNYSSLAAGAAARTFDTIVTCRQLARGARETVLPTQSCAGVASYSAAFVLTGYGAQWLAHRKEHHRWESVAHIANFALGVAGAVITARNARGHGGIF